MTAPMPVLGPIKAYIGTAKPDWRLYTIDDRGLPIPYAGIGAAFTVEIEQAGTRTVVTTQFTITPQANPGPGTDANDTPSLIAARTAIALDLFKPGDALLIVRETTTVRRHEFELNLLR